MFRSPPIVDASIMNTPMIIHNCKANMKRKEKSIGYKNAFIKMKKNIVTMYTQLTSQETPNIFGFLMISHIMLGSCKMRNPSAKLKSVF